LSNWNGDSLHPLTPLWREDVFELCAVQKTGSTQFGSVPIALRGNGMRAAVGYRRYRDCDKSDVPGQDFAIARGDTRHLVGVLADGVGQSFYGNLAAEHVCMWLLPELWRRREDPPDEGELEEGLKHAEREFAKVVETVSLSHLPDWHRPALEATRKLGSQAVFAAFIWEFTSGRGYLYQVGDAIAMVHRNGSSERIEAAPNGRWSSAGRSRLLLLRTALVDTTGILLKSDGADPSWGSQLDRQTADSQEFFEMANRRAENDDVSFVSGLLCGGHPVPPFSDRRGYGEVKSSPQPQRVSTYMQGAIQPDRAQQPVSKVNDAPSAPQSVPPRKPLQRAKALLFRVSAIAAIFLSGFALGFVIRKSRGPSSPQASPRQTKQVANVATSETSSAANLRLLARATDTKPTASVEAFLSENPRGVVFGIHGENVTISGIGLGGVKRAYHVRSGATSEDGAWYVSFPELSPDIGPALPQLSDGADLGADRFQGSAVTVRVYCHLRGGPREMMVEGIVQLENKERYYSISVSQGAK